MINLIDKSKLNNSKWVLTIGLIVSVFLFSGFRSDNFQQSRQDVQIESEFESPSNSGLETLFLFDFTGAKSCFSLNVFSGFSVLQLLDFNSSLRSYFKQFSSPENLQEAVLFFISKTIPLSSDEDSHVI